MTENRFLIDWFAFSVKSLTVPEVQELIGLDDTLWETIKGFYGYKKRLYFDGISIHYDGSADMGIWVEFSGSGCRTFEQYSAISFDLLFSVLMLRNDVNITRLDVAFDDFEGVLNLETLCTETLAQNYVSPMKYWEVTQSSSGSTVYFGSPRSAIRFRIYDKAAQQNLVGLHWVRFEVQMRDERASVFLNDYLVQMPLGEIFMGVVNRYLRFLEPSGDSNKSRWPIAVWWSTFVEGVGYIRFRSDDIADDVDVRHHNYVVNQAGSSIALFLELYGVERLIEEVELCLPRSLKSAKHNAIRHKMSEWKNREVPEVQGNGD